MAAFFFVVFPAEGEPSKKRSHVEGSSSAEGTGLLVRVLQIFSGCVEW